MVEDLNYLKLKKVIKNLTIVRNIKKTYEKAQEQINEEHEAKVAAQEEDGDDAEADDGALGGQDDAPSSSSRTIRSQKRRWSGGSPVAGMTSSSTCKSINFNLSFTYFSLNFELKNYLFTYLYNLV